MKRASCLERSAALVGVRHHAAQRWSGRWPVLLLVVVAGCGRTEPTDFEALAAQADAGAKAAAPDAGPPLACAPGDWPLTKATPKAMFVLDRSTSMRTSFGAQRLSRWVSLTNGLAQVLPLVDDSLELGALLFPTVGGASCSVGSAPSLPVRPRQGQALLSLMRATTPNGNTPTADAIRAAGNQLLATPAAATARALVLATDGAPNCNPNLATPCRCADGATNCQQATRCLDDTRAIGEVRRLAQRGVPTYVIGIQDTSASALGVLSDLARAGGRARDAGVAYLAVSSEADLSTALVDISRQVGACVYVTPSVPDANGELVVSLGSRRLAADSTDGWSWADREHGELHLHGGACALALANPLEPLRGRVDCGRDAGR